MHSANERKEYMVFPKFCVNYLISKIPYAWQPFLHAFFNDSKLMYNLNFCF